MAPWRGPVEEMTTEQLLEAIKQANLAILSAVADIAAATEELGRRA